MSASSKKKLRKEQKAEMLTQKQQQAQAEAKKLKVTTIVFVAVILAVVITFASVLVVNAIKNSGIVQKNTIAAVVADEELNSVEFSYYYNDVISNTYNQWSTQYGDNVATYMLLMGLDMSAPLDEQTYPSGDGEQTWADYFVEAALDRAKSDYALYNAAMANGHKMTETEQQSMETSAANMSFYAQIYGYKNVDKYLKAMYGPGANEKSYNAYSEISAIAASYYNAYGDSLSYEKDEIQAYAEDIATDYNSYDYAYYYLSYSKFLGEGTKDDKGNVTHTEAEKEAAREAAKVAAESLLNAKTVKELDAAIGALKFNQGTSAASTKRTGDFGSSLNATFADWLTDSSRVENDIAMFVNDGSASHDHAEGEADHEHTVEGYYVVLYQGMKDNDRPVGNVRHLLVKFVNGTKDEEGNTVYSDEEKAAVKQEAESYLETWKSGAATEESFIELVKKHSDDTSASTGGLFEDITPVSNYVPNFLNWSIDETRKTGDTEVIETEYGYHVMYYVGASELSYREMLIADDMLAEDLDAWYQDILKPVEATAVELKHIDTDMILAH